MPYIKAPKGENVEHFHYMVTTTECPVTYVGDNVYSVPAKVLEIMEEEGLDFEYVQYPPLKERVKQVMEK